MSELIDPKSRGNLKRYLLAGASASGLLFGMANGTQAEGDASHPTVWIELGADLGRIDGTGDGFSPPFFANYADSPNFKPVSPLGAQRAPRFAIGPEGKITFAPNQSDWVFSASLRYGRSNSTRHVHQQSYVQRSKYSPPYTASGVVHPGQRFPRSNPEEGFLDVKTIRHESHLVLDFQAGKDVGLGLFNRGATSVVGIGVRFAQLSASTKVDIKARPDLQVYDIFPGSLYAPGYRFHEFTVAGDSSRSFRAIGPSITWEASDPIAGDTEDTQFTLDWGVNASVLFGRQKAHTHHQTTNQYFVQKYHNGFSSGYTTLYQHAPPDQNRSRFVVSPNVGGFAGISVKFPNSKVSVGYRADIFFNAVDAGIDSRRSQSLSFHGPFATITVGLGG